MPLSDDSRSSREIIKAREKFFNLLFAKHFDVDAATSDRIENTFVRKKRLLFVNGIIYKDSFELMYLIVRSRIAITNEIDH